MSPLLAAAFGRAITGTALSIYQADRDIKRLAMTAIATGYRCRVADAIKRLSSDAYHKYV